jgi:hypothetical protein
MVSPNTIPGLFCFELSCRESCASAVEAAARRIASFGGSPAVVYLRWHGGLVNLCPATMAGEEL